MKSKYKIEMVDVDKLLPAGFNPSQRVKMNSAMKSLIESMEEDGFWPWAYILITSDYYIADGHRRVTAAKLTGIKEVPCVKTDKDKAELAILWNKSNSLKAKLTSPQLMDAFLCYPVPEEILPKSNVGSDIRTVYNEFGLGMIKKLREHHKGINTVVWSKILGHRVYDKTEFKDNIENLIDWVINTKTTIRDIRVTLELNLKTKDEILALIESDQPLKVVESVST